MKRFPRVQRAIAAASRLGDSPPALADLAAAVRSSPHHAWRELKAVLGESPKQFTLRLQLDRAAAALVATRAPIIDIALAHGFQNHETFSRAFRRRYAMSPSEYRRRGLAGDPALHAAFVNGIGPCAGLYHLDRRESTHLHMTYEIQTQERAAQPVLVVRRRVARAEIAATIGQELPRVFLHAQQRGFALAGHPVTRYLDTSYGSVTLETGMRIAAPADHPWTADQGEGDIVAETLPGGLTAVTVHAGLYDRLVDAYAAVEHWIAEQGYRPRGAPYEIYLTDPGDHPDPQEWRTEVCWPVESA